MRRFYVAPAERKRGVGSMLANALLQEALATGKPLGVHAATDARAAVFWSRIGFDAVDHPAVSHLWPGREWR
jgi:GNAT superfamily N-acetyltransferase